MSQSTLLFLVKNKRVLLAMKKRGFGKGWWNGVGGKIEPNEQLITATTRECQEEIGVQPTVIEKVAHHTFFHANSATLVVHVFICRAWIGKPKESDEMAPQWFNFDTIPYGKMWEDDQHWLPHVLSGKRVIGDFTFDESYRLLAKKVQFVTASHALLQP